MSSPRWRGPTLVAVGSLLWATDALVRVPALSKQDPAFIVFVEHLVGVLALLPVLFFQSRRRLFSIGPLQNWAALALVGAGGSALALLFFTEAFRFLNPTVNILLQKTQPIAVVLIAQSFLGEKPGRSFYPWAAVALLACIALNVFDSSPPTGEAFPVSAKGLALSLGASGIWAISTVVGKRLLTELEPLVATFWRFVFGLITLSALVVFGSDHAILASLLDPAFRLSYLYLGLFPGVLALWTYYSGMKQTSATTTTFVELVFPVGSIALNALFLGARLSLIQLGASVVLLFAIARISLSGSGAHQPKR